jgi:outer membrane receptor protein involved in Fe transport
MENINEFVKNNPIGKDIAFPLPQEDLAAATQDVFKILSEKDDVVVSVSKFAQKTTEAPADVTVISREQIRRSGFRNLTEALNFVPQVYTHWVGQNWSSDFRGLFVNNQIERRVLYLQDGKKLNDYFHFGEFYSDVYTDMERIEKIEVIKGPGAALYGNNSITGVVNIITRKPTKKNEMEFITEYDSVLRNLTTRALYYSKFSEKFSVSFDASRFEGKGLYTSGYDSWGGNRFYDPNLGANAANFNSTPANSTMGTSEYGRNTAEVDTGQRLWTSTGMMADNGKWFPNYNLDVKYGDWNLKSFYMSKRTSWIPPQVDAGAFGGDTVYGSPRNDRIWGTGVMSLDYNPSYLEKYEANVKIFRQLNINSDYRDKDYQGFSQATNPPGAPAGYGNNATARLASQSYLNYIKSMGGGIVKRYASTAKAEGVEFQLTPFKFENKNSVVKVFRFMTGGNMQSVNYINYQVNVGRNGLIDRRQ